MKKQKLRNSKPKWNINNCKYPSNNLKNGKICNLRVIKRINIPNTFTFIIKHRDNSFNGTAKMHSRQYHKRDHKCEESFIIIDSDTVVEPLAMMIEMKNTFIALGTMFGCLLAVSRTEVTV